MTDKVIEEMLDAAKAAKEAADAVRKSHEELDGRVKKIDEEMKAGKVDAVAKTAFQQAVERVEKTEKTLDEVNKVLTDLKMQSERSGMPKDAKSLGRLVWEADVAKGYRGGNMTLLEIEGEVVRKALTSGDDSAGELIQPYRRPDIIVQPEMPLTVRDLFPSIPISSNAIEWVLEKLFTNNAGAQAKEGDAKPQSDLTFESKTSPVSTIAHWIPASRQVLADAPQLAGIIDTKLRYGLKLKEDTDLLHGDGTNGTVLGLVPQATDYDSTGIPAGAKNIDHVRWAVLQVTKALYPATFAVMSLDDWAKIQMTKTEDGAYIFGTPSDGAAPRLWGKRVVESFGMPVNDFLVGSSFAATIYDREQVTVRVAEQHADFFIKNMVAILCEERLGFTVDRPAAIVHGTFPV